MNNASGPIILIVLIPLGFALLWARHLAYRHRPLAVDDAMKLILSIAAWVSIFVGIVGAVVHGLFILSPIGLVLVIGVAIMLVTRYRALERRSLLRCLSVAVQKGVPLNEAAHAFADERSDELGLRAIRFAEAIEAGMPLPQALTYSGTRLPIDALLAVRIGYETGTLSEALRRVARTDTDLDLLVRSLFEKVLYLLWIWLVMVGAVTYMMLNIVPIFEKMFLEFELKLPAMTQLLITISDWLEPFAVFLFPLTLALFGICCLGALHYVDLLPRGAPLVSWFSRRWDGALVLRALAMSINLGWPMNKTIWLLARLYPSGPVRGRLVAAGKRIDNGENWAESLRTVGLMGGSELAVLESASRVGNLEWALDAMSDSLVRRFVYRLRIAVNFLFPVTLFAFGIVIGFVVVSLFVPLISLIQELS